MFNIVSEKLYEFIEKQVYIKESKSYDSVQKTNRFKTYLSKREVLEKVNQLEKEKKQIQLNIHSFNHAHTFEIDSKLISLY